MAVVVGLIRRILPVFGDAVPTFTAAWPVTVLLAGTWTTPRLGVVAPAAKALSSPAAVPAVTCRLTETDETLLVGMPPMPVTVTSVATLFGGTVTWVGVARVDRIGVNVPPAVALNVPYQPWVSRITSTPWVPVLVTFTCPLVFTGTMTWFEMLAEAW